MTALPGLIKTTQQMEAASADDAAYRRSCAAVSARVHHLAATTLSKIGEADLAWIAAERAMQAADDADDPLVLASAARSGTHALLAVGRFENALELGEVAARWLRPRMGIGDPAALSLSGMLYLRTAVAAARHQDRSTALELLAHAGRAADQLGVDANYWQTGFGPSNVELHRISAALDLGDVTQVIDFAPRVDVEQVIGPMDRSSPALPVSADAVISSAEWRGSRCGRLSMADFMRMIQAARDLPLGSDSAAEVTWSMCISRGSASSLLA